MMHAGKLDRRVEIRQATETQAPGSGQPIETWATVATVWAEVSPMRPFERLASREMQAWADTKFRVRFLDGVHPKCRLLYDGREWDIKTVSEIGRRAGLEIEATARAE
jgi:SPP1 family predicted phage head-tail adaptor